MTAQKNSTRFELTKAAELLEHTNALATDWRIRLFFWPARNIRRIQKHVAYGVEDWQRHHSYQQTTESHTKKSSGIGTSDQHKKRSGNEGSRVIFFSRIYAEAKIQTLFIIVARVCMYVCAASLYSSPRYWPIHSSLIIELKFWVDVLFYFCLHLVHSYLIFSLLLSQMCRMDKQRITIIHSMRLTILLSLEQLLFQISSVVRHCVFASVLSICYVQTENFGHTTFGIRMIDFLPATI